VGSQKGISGVTHPAEGNVTLIESEYIAPLTETITKEDSMIFYFEKFFRLVQ